MNLPTIGGCCDPCVEPTTTQVPGPQGPAGADGTNGTDGIDAFTTAPTGFNMPAYSGNTASLLVGNSAWMVVGQIVWVAGGGTSGFMQVVSKADTTHVVLKNLDDNAGAYADNSAPGTAFPNGTAISPGGVQGPAGSAPGGTFFAIANNLSEGVAATMRTNLGLGSIATFDQGVANGNVPNIDDAGGIGANEVVWGNGIAIEGRDAAASRTGLGLGTSAVVDTGVADTKIAANDGALTPGDLVAASAAGIKTVDATTARTALGISSITNGYGVILRISALNLNAAGVDKIVDLVSAGITRFRLDKITFSNPSTALSTAHFGAFTNTGGGGTAIALGQSAPNVASSTGTFGDLVLETVATTNYLAANFYVRITIAQTGATVDLSVWGWDLS